MAGITRDTMIREVLVGYPDAADVFERNGLACASCLGVRHGYRLGGCGHA